MNRRLPPALIAGGILVGLVIAAALVSLVNFLVDLSYRLIDPRIRSSA